MGPSLARPDGTSVRPTGEVRRGRQHVGFGREGHDMGAARSGAPGPQAQRGKGQTAGRGLGAAGNLGGWRGTTDDQRSSGRH
jgi:hypothetical protein